MIVLTCSQSQVPVPISGQAPIVSVTDAVPLLRTSQEKLISGLTHSKLDVNFTGNTQNMTLLHYAAMVAFHVSLW